MPDAEITKSKVLFKKEEGGFTSYANFIRYEVHDEDTGMITQTLVLNRKNVDDLGWPEELTVTIEPGDKLNEEKV